jgi:hypothetical protein
MCIHVVGLLNVIQFVALTAVEKQRIAIDWRKQQTAGVD